jgi:hypothetical protein
VTSSFGDSRLDDSIPSIGFTQPSAISPPLEDSIARGDSFVLAASSPPPPTVDLVHSDGFFCVNGSSIFLSILFQSTGFLTPSVDFTHSTTWHFETVLNVSSDSSFVSTNSSIGVIVGVGVAVAALFLVGVSFVVVFFFRCRRSKEIHIFDSNEIPCDSDFTDSTLNETLLISSDTVTMDNTIPNMVSTFG